VAYTGYCFEKKNNKLCTINVKLAAISYHHKIKFGVDLPMSHYWLSAAKKSIERRQGSDGGNVQQLRLPLRWELLTTGRQACEQYQYDVRRCHLGQVIWCGLALSYLLLARTSELFADDKSKMVHTDFGLLRSDLSFFDAQEQQLQRESRARAVTVEVRFRGCKADQQRRGAVVQHGGDALHILLHLLQLDTTISNTAPLMSYTESTDSATVVKTVTSKLATSYLRYMVSAAGQSARATNYTIHSGRIGGATALAAAGVADSAIMAAGRWKSDAYLRYIRPTRQDAAVAAKALTAATIVHGQPGEGTLWS
jgi:hypothetical protein